jgi:hypothetical protein
MKPVSFADVDLEDDIIVAFFISDAVDSFGFGGYTILAIRTSKYEFILEEWERRPRLSNEKQATSKGEQFLEAVTINLEKKTIILKGSSEKHVLDVTKLEKEEINRVITGFKKLNFDEKFKLELK